MKKLFLILILLITVPDAAQRGDPPIHRRRAVSIRPSGLRNIHITWYFKVPYPLEWGLFNGHVVTMEVIQRGVSKGIVSAVCCPIGKTLALDTVTTFDAPLRATMYVPDLNLKMTSGDPYVHDFGTWTIDPPRVRIVEVGD